MSDWQAIRNIRRLADEAKYSLSHEPNIFWDDILEPLEKLQLIINDCDKLLQTWIAWEQRSKKGKLKSSH